MKNLTRTSRVDQNGYKASTIWQTRVEHHNADSPANSNIHTYFMSIKITRILHRMNGDSTSPSHINNIGGVGMIKEK